MKLRVLIVDDSRTARLAMRIALENERDIAVVGEAVRGEDVMSALERHDANLVLLDLYLGSGDGLEVAATIMAERAVPIVLVTSADVTDPTLVYRALEVGVLEVCSKLPGPNSPSYTSQRARLLRIMRTMVTVPVVHRGRARGLAPSSPPLASSSPRSQPPVASSAGADLVVIGASTGGPPIVAGILEKLQAPFSRPIVVVQHIMADFVEGFASWLESATSHRVVVVAGLTALEPGRVYIAQGEHHIVLRSPSTVNVSSDPPIRHQRPSIDRLFEDAAAQFGDRAVGVLLTGMGSDGARGMEALRRTGATTFAQDLETCAVSSMPKSAIERNGVTRVATPSELPRLIRAGIGSTLESTPVSVDGR